MSDYQQIPGNIRSLLATKSQTWTNHAADLATQYAALCDDTNQRLRRCAEYLRRGMRSAAIHLADCQPNLMQAVGSLHFPERTAWADLCVNHGMQAPAVLEIECLGELKAAYDREKVLQPLLSRHRLLAIAKAPAAARLDVTRLLAREDSSNPIWQQEIRELEMVRLQEIESELLPALRDQNAAVLDTLWAELTTQTWLNEIPASILDPLQAKADELKTRRTLAELPALVTQILSAFGANPPRPETSDLIKKWKETIATLAVPVPNDLAAKVQPIMDWDIAEQRRKLELQEVKPLQYLFASSAPPAPDRKLLVPIIVIVMSVLAIAAALGYYYFRHHLRR